MEGKVLGVERRRRWNRDEKARIVEEALAPGAVVSEVARRPGVAQSLLFTWRRLARRAAPSGRDGSILLPVEIDARAAPRLSEAARPSRPATNGRRAKSGVMESNSAPEAACASTTTSTPTRFGKVLSVLGER